jgi:hypothetical protein
MARVMGNQPIEKVTRKVVVADNTKQVGIPLGVIIEEKDVFNCINELRKMPHNYSAKIKEIGKFIDSDPTIQVTGDGERRWHEGKTAFLEAIDFLSTAKAVSPLTLSPELSKSADDLVRYIGPTGLNTDILADKTDPPTRFSRYGAFNGTIIELLVFAARDAQDCVIKCCVCDGDKSRADRSVLLDSKFKVCGLSSGPHKQMGTLISIILAEEFEAKTSAPKNLAQAAASTVDVSGVDFNANKPEVSFKEVEQNVYTLTIVGAGNPPPNVTLEKKDDAIVLKRFHNGKEIATANYGIPIPFELSETTATYSKGTIVVAIKPVLESVIESEEAGTVKLPDTGLGDRVNISAAQDNDSITINLAPSKFETEIVVNLDHSEAGRTTVNIVQAFAMPEGDSVCKCTATSSFRLPFTTNASACEVSTEKITVKPASVTRTPGEQKDRKPKEPAAGEIQLTVI